MQPNKEVNILLTVEEVNIILGALGKGPFEQVYKLIGNIEKQATEQLNEKKNDIDTHSTDKH